MICGMNDIVFSNTFRFDEICNGRSWHTDRRDGSPYHYLAYMREGGGRLVGSDREIEVGEGDFLYIPDGYPYQSYWQGENVVRFDSYGFKYFPRTEGKTYPLQRIEADAEAIKLLERLAADKRVNCASIGLFYQLLGTIEVRMTTTESRKERLIDEAESFMYSREGYTIADVAKHCGVSESALYSAFREVRGCTPLMIRHRMLADKAVRLLTTTDLSVEAVSERLGFSSSIYFRKIIAEQTGKTPRAIRKERRI